jgi:hypothetical protein
MGIMTGYGKIDQDLALEHFGPVADRLGLAPENLEEMARQTAARVKKLMVSWT